MRRDRRGRRIGENWWRAYNTELFFLQTATWEAQLEAAANGWAAEAAEFTDQHPRPTFKALLLANKGMHSPR